MNNLPKYDSSAFFGGVVADEYFLDATGIFFRQAVGFGCTAGDMDFDVGAKDMFVDGDFADETKRVHLFVDTY